MSAHNTNHNVAAPKEYAPLAENPTHRAIANIQNPNKLRKFIAGASLGLIMLAGCGANKPGTDAQPHEASTTTVHSDPEQDRPDKTIAVLGDQECQDDTQAALNLLSTAAPESYQTAIDYIDVIECVAQGSGMAAYEESPKFIVGDATRQSGTVWYASAIVHDATHSELYHQFEAANPGQPVPADVWTGEQAEATCLAAQAQALTDMGAPAATIDFVLDSLETRYWEVENEDRTW